MTEDSARSRPLGQRATRPTVVIVAAAVLLVALLAVIALYQPLGGVAFATGDRTTPNRVAFELRNGGYLPVRVTRIETGLPWLSARLGSNPYHVSGTRDFTPFELRHGDQAWIVLSSTLAACNGRVGSNTSLDTVTVHFSAVRIPRKQRITFTDTPVMTVAWRSDSRGTPICNVTVTP